MVENQLLVNDLIYLMFILMGKDCCEFVELMLGIECFFIDLMLEEVLYLVNFGVFVIVFFFVVN